MQNLYTTQELSKILKVDVQTVRHWLRSGKIPATKLAGENGDWRIKEKELQKFINGFEK